MRTARTVLALAALAFLSPRGAAAWPGAAPGRDPASLAALARIHRQWVMAVRAPGPLAVMAPGRRAMPARLASRLSALGMTPIRTLADAPGGLDLASALESRARALEFGAAGPLAAPPRPAAQAAFGCDPTRIWLIEAADSSSGALAASALAREGDVEWIEPNHVRLPQGWTERVLSARAKSAPHEAEPAGASGVPAFPNDPLFQWGHQWGLFNIGPAGQFGGTPRADSHAVEGWSITTGSDDVILAVADTGIDPDQPDLAGNIADGRSRLYAAVNLTGVDPPDSIYDRRGHGDGTTGVMAARTNNGISIDTLGMAGVCGGDGITNSGCRIVPMKVTVGTTEEASSFALAQSFLYAAAVGARGMNLSIAGNESSELERLALYDAITHGCVVSAAAGNTGSQAFPLYPSAYAIDGYCIEVGATDSMDQLAAFSTYGPWMDLVAPGQNIVVAFMTYPNPFGGSFPGYLVSSGTSFSAPHVAGTIGLLAAIRPDLIENDFQRIIRESAHDLGAPGVDTTYGYGRLDIGAALAAVPKSDGIWHGEVAGALGNLVATDTLVIADSSQAVGGPPPRVWPSAKLFEVTASVAIPDSFSGPVRIWPRVGGTTTVHAGFKLAYFAPWAEVASQSAHSFTLRGYIYETADTCAGCEQFQPVPESELTFGFTVMGPVSRGSPPPSNGGPLPLSIAPNPALGVARITSLPGASVRILDLNGRLVREAAADPVTGIWNWDGLDSHGRRVRAGIYVVRSSAAGQSRGGKLVVLR